MNTGMPQNQPPQSQPQPPMPPQQGQNQGMPQQPYPAQQYGQQPYYGPPPKKSNLALILILVGVFVFIPMVGCLALAAVPLITENTSDARRAEGDAVAGMVKTQLRTLYSKSGKIPNRSDTEVAQILSGAVGEYISSVEYESLPRPGDSRFSQGGAGKITVAMKSSADGVLVLEFDYLSGVPLSNEWTR
ncbi:MAG: hypothetical protein L3J82_02165 [Planctomycetes bacterium]|nr:hypothetical protein [Planctomycetota bacterium]